MDGVRVTLGLFKETLGRNLEGSSPRMHSANTAQRKGSGTRKGPNALQGKSDAVLHQPLKFQSKE